MIADVCPINKYCKSGVNITTIFSHRNAPVVFLLIIWLGYFLRKWAMAPLGIFTYQNLSVSKLH